MTLRNVKKEIALVISVSLALLASTCERGVVPSLIKEKVLCAQAGEQILPHLAVLDDGRFWVGWFSQSGSQYQVRLNLFDAEGTPQLGAAGILVSDKPSDTWVMDYDLVADGQGRATIVFSDLRTGVFDVQAYQISTGGEFLWGKDGINLSANAIPDYTPRAFASAAGDVTVAWTQEQNDESRLVLQRLSAAGQPQWGSGRIVSGSPGKSCYRPVIASGGGESVLLAWVEASTPTEENDRAVYCQKFGPDGSSAWNAKVLVSNGLTIPFYRSPLAEADGQGGLFVAWQAVSTEGRLKAFLQHLDAGGKLTCGAEGIALSDSAAVDQIVQHISYAENPGEAAVVWAEATTSLQSVYLQGFATDGRRRWGDSGILAAGKEGEFFDPLAIRGLAGGFTVFWQDYPFGDKSRSRMNGAWVALTAAPAISPVALADTASTKVHATVSRLINGGFWLLWEDKRRDGSDIYGTFWKPK